MSNYEPLFLKYRPQILSDVLGQNSVKETLINAINNQKIVHAYLLTGPRGSGKTSSARILAKSLNCTAGEDGKSPTVKPCGKCESCLSIANSSSIDVTEIDAASHGHVDDARKLIEKVNLASVSGKYRVYIIDEVHMLTNSAFNALLKVIEEPPNNVVFILATTEVDKVPKTISSRCQQLRFKPISPLDCFERLEYVAQEEKINIDRNALELIAAHADGAMRDALSLLDQLSVFSDDNNSITEDKVLEIIGAIPSEELKLLTKHILMRNPSGLIDKLNDFLSRGKDAISIVQELTGYLLELLEELNAKEAKEKFQDIRTMLQEAKIENYEIVQILDSLTELEIRMRQGVQNKNLLRAWLVKICHRADILVVKDLLARIEKLEKGLLAPGSRLEAPGSKLEARGLRLEPSQKAQKTRNLEIAKKDETPRVSNPEPRTNSEPEIPRTSTLEPRTKESAAFLDYLSPGSKGMFISSHSQLIRVEADTAYIEMPEKFKFLKSKLEARSEEFLSAISKDCGLDLTNFRIELVEKINQKLPEAIAPPQPEAKTQVKVKTLEMEANILKSNPETCINRQKSESFTGALQDKETNLSPEETKLNEAVETAVSIFGGKEI